MDANPRLLTIDDDAALRRSIRSFFEDAGFEVWDAESGRDGLELFRGKRPDVVLVDLIMPGISGLEVIETLAGEAPEIPLVVLSGAGIIADAIEAIRKGAWDYVTKPVMDLLELEHVIAGVMERARLREESRRYRERLEEEVLQRTRELTQLNGQLEKRASELSALNHLARELGFELTTESAVETSLRHVVESIGPDVALIFIMEERSLILKGIASGDPPESDDALPSIRRVAEHFCGLAAAGLQAVFSGDIPKDHPGVFEECAKAGLYSFCAVPLMSAGEIIGVLGTASRQERDFHDEAAFLEALSNEIAIGLKNNILYHKAQNFALELQARLAQIEEAEQEKLELIRQLNQAQKLEAVGTLAAGIAHDFNNILSAIIGYTELARLKTAESGLHGYHDRILESCERARRLVGQILTFCRATEQERKPVDLGSIVEEGVKMVRATIPTMIEVRRNLAPGSSTVLADPTQMHQVFINLCTNAAYAMREKGGLLEVGLENLEVTPEMSNGEFDLAPGPYMKLTVSDTGAGIAPEIMHRIFEPFFTTKPKGDGTGLGLSVVYGIVKQCGGDITVQSRFGDGSVFNVYLPVTADASEADRDSGDDLPEGAEHILFVDDEPVIVDICREILEGLGYRVTATEDGLTALEKFRNDPGQFDLVVTDMNMPGITGVELSKEILKLRADTPIILCTGFNEFLTEAQIRALGIKGFAMKPLSRRDIAELVRKTLDGREGPTG